MNILIVGGLGFIGHHIAAKCIAVGHQAVLGVRNTNHQYAEIACNLLATTTSNAKNTNAATNTNLIFLPRWCFSAVLQQRHVMATFSHFRGTFNRYSSCINY